MTFCNGTSGWKDGKTSWANMHTLIMLFCFINKYEMFREKQG